MTVVVSFITPKGIGSVDAPGVGRVRIRENLAVGGTTVASALQGEVVIIGNGETSMIAAAFGTTPDAAATAETVATSAGVPIASASIGVPLMPAAGDKVNVKTVT